MSNDKKRVRGTPLVEIRGLKIEGFSDDKWHPIIKGIDLDLKLEIGDVQQTVAKTLGLKPEQVKVNVTLLGGGFGRRIVNEYASDAALLSRQIGKPVQLVWSRPDDFAHDMYQPMFVARLDAALDAKGHLSAWRHRIASPAVTADFGGVAMEAETLGAREMPYASPNIRIEYTHVMQASG